MLCYAKSLQLCPTLCDPIDGSPPGSIVPGILQARILEWVAISFSSAWKEKSETEVAQSCPTLSDPMDCSPPGSSIHGIFQARVLEWGAIAFSWSRALQKSSCYMKKKTNKNGIFIYGKILLYSKDQLICSQLVFKLVLNWILSCKMTRKCPRA